MRAQLGRDFERFRRELPRDFAAHVREAYRIDLTARYLGFTLPHPIGKGSGQLSLSQEQLENDRAAGLAFVVLKTVVAEDAAGARAMEAWAIHETRMKVERVRSASGLEGWTVTWKGRGWDRSLHDYLQLIRHGRRLDMLVVPSVKYHLPRLDEAFHVAEYVHTTKALAEAWGEGPLLLEVDFSPTLAGDPLAGEREQILRWIREIPPRLRSIADVRIALKLMNARFDDDFQVAMVEAGKGADALVVFNRLFDQSRGVAYGGWDLSDRNLRVLDRVRHPHMTGTGNVNSGRMIAEYARRGCESVQLHTMFQLPLEEFPGTGGSRTQRVLHQLVFDPRDGLLAVMMDGGYQRFLDIADRAHRAS
jgi:hypothetical protein